MSLKVIFMKISQNFVKSPLKISLLSQISAKSLWHVCIRYDLLQKAKKKKKKKKKERKKEKIWMLSEDL